MSERIECRVKTERLSCDYYYDQEKQARYSRIPGLLLIRCSHQFELGQILRINQADGLAPGVDHDQIVNRALVEDLQGLGGQGLFANTDGIAGHDLGQRL